MRSRWWMVGLGLVLDLRQWIEVAAGEDRRKLLLHGVGRIEAAPDRGHQVNDVHKWSLIYRQRHITEAESKRPAGIDIHRFRKGLRNQGPGKVVILGVLRGDTPVRV